MKKLITKMIEVKDHKCENCGSGDKVYRIIEKNNFHSVRKTDGFLCKKCWLLASKTAYEEEYMNKEQQK